MIDIDKWQEIFATMQRHKLRTSLTAFGVFWGIFMLVVLLGAGKGMENGLLSGFGAMKNAVYIAAGSPTSMAYQGLSKGRLVTFNDEDVAAIRHNITEVNLVVAGNSAGPQFVERGTKSDSYSVNGAQPVLLNLQSQKIEQGRYINPLDMQQRRKVAVIGTRVRDVLFSDDDEPVGKSIEIKGISFRVVGVFVATGTNNFDERAAETIYIPNTTLRYTFNQLDRIDQFIITPMAGVRAEVVEQRVETLLKERHRIHPDDPSPIATFNVQQRFDQLQALFTGMAVFSWLVAIGTIIAGVIGVGNIMLIVVKDRTREIGIRKAVGATPLAIVSMIVQESLVITGIAGYFGLVVGVFLLEGIAAQLEKNTDGGGFFSQPEISFETALIAMAVLMISGALAALLPASKAANIDPVWALQVQ
ncbi:MAG: ABC transporter permease [Pseudomonadales bacterium]